MQSTPGPFGELLHRLCSLSAQMRGLATRDILNSHGLDMRDWLVLAGLSELQPTTQSELTIPTKLDKVAVNRAVARLREAGLIAIRPNVHDGRSHLIELSEKGRLAYMAASSAIYDMEQDILAHFDPEETTQLKYLIGRLEIVVGHADAFKPGPNALFEYA